MADHLSIGDGGVSTYLRPLMSAMLASPFSIAPEREIELVETLSQHGITGDIIEDDPHQHFCARLLLRKVRVGLPALERIWAYSYSAMYVYNEFEQTNFKGPVKLAGNPVGDKIRELLRWALLAEIEQICSDWPENTPRPDHDESTDQTLKAANHLFLHAVGFCFLHEIGVKGHKHEPTTTEQEQVNWEFEADRWACDWVLGRCKEHKNHANTFITRAVFLAMTFAILAVIEFYQPKEVRRKTHPNPIDRLLQFLERYAADASGPPAIYPWFAATTIIQLHRTNSEFYEPSKKWADARSFLIEIRGEFEKRVIR